MNPEQDIRVFKYKITEESKKDLNTLIVDGKVSITSAYEYVYPSKENTGSIKVECSSTNKLSESILQKNSILDYI